MAFVRIVVASRTVGCGRSSVRIPRVKFRGVEPQRRKPTDDFEPTRPEDRVPLLPGFDPMDSPLSPGGKAVDGWSPGTLAGLVDFPSEPDRRRVVYRVRREGWVARRAAARERFRDLHGN